MLRWAKLLSRYNANAAAMADPEVAALPLIARSVEAVKYAMDVQPPYFVGRIRTATGRSSPTTARPSRTAT